ncbi:thioredoxin domain-containing protein [Candidatus Woesearchaeota archaeon]|nr:thioredoxin domain-containing protein [Candidatus Woesearchaeota archaeon]
MDKDKINWFEWNGDSFEKSRSENKPILLNLTAVWCHWCHVIKVTTYSDDEVAAVINREFVPIKVCIDQRPDIRDRYNMGGFPSTVFLDSDGNIIAGETYVPPGRMKAMLNTIRSLYDKKDFKVNKPEQVQEEKPSVELNEGMAREILVSIEDNQDSYYGGFGLLDMALKALDWMHGGIYDLIEGGFFRYSVTQDWKTPHYEKMLDTNAGLLRNYIKAFSITNNEKYKKIAEGIIEYVNKNLKNEDGGFYGHRLVFNDDFFLYSCL